MSVPEQLGQPTTTEDLFVVPLQSDEYIIYAPLRRIAIRLNRDGVTAAANLVSGSGIDMSDRNQAAIYEAFSTNGLLEAVPEDLIPRVPAPHKYKGMVLALTAKCNLRCVYCYARGGATALTMSWRIAKAALDQMLPWIAAQNDGCFWLNFHGGGEALVEKRLLFTCVDYAKELSERHGVKLNCGITTNATLIDKPVADWIAGNFRTATLSLDGLASHQNYQRPVRGGRPSFERAMRGARLLRERGVRFSVRATITPVNLPQLVEIVEFYASEVLGELRVMHVEPVEQIGRGCDWGDASRMDVQEFVTSYIRASRAADRLGLLLSTSGDRLRRRASTTFCGAQGSGLMCITPEGYISACTRVTQASEDSSHLFFYGQYKADEGRFAFWEDRCQRLREKQIQYLPDCRDCFCKWHCSGHCLSSREIGETQFNCEVSRALSAWRLSEIAGIPQKATPVSLAEVPHWADDCILGADDSHLP
jgi:uncharacterized protein